MFTQKHKLIARNFDILSEKNHISNYVESNIIKLYQRPPEDSQNKYVNKNK